MSNETKLIIKIIVINLIVGLILMAFMSSKAQVLPPFPTAWGIGQQVHVKFTDFPDADKSEAIRYIKSKIDPLHLDIKLIFDDNLVRPDGIKEGIEFINLPYTTTVCAKTSTVAGLTNDNQWAVKKTIRLDTTCEGGTMSDGDFWYNNILHEFLHGLFIPHLPYLPSMPVPLMWSTLTLRERLVWSFNDEWNLKRLYSRNKLINYRRMAFRRLDLGKTCYLVKEDKSVSFTVKFQSELLPYLDKLDSYRRVVQ